MICENCKKPLIIHPSGNQKSSILVIGTEIRDGETRPFQDESGYILRTEFVRWGYDLWNMDLTYYWRHKPDRKCAGWMGEQLLEQARNKKAVILVGVEPARYFLKKTSTDITGLIVHPNILSEDKLVMGCIHPSEVIGKNGVVGELRLSVTKICKELERRKIE